MSGMKLSDQERAFLIGLAKLTRETGIHIHGCGCCGSPSLQDDTEITSDESGYGFGYTNNVTWLDPAEADDWENYKESIVR